MYTVMQNEGVEKIIFEWWDNNPYELKIQKETEPSIKLWEYILKSLYLVKTRFSI